LLTGIFYRSELGLHNSIAVVGNGSGFWHKQKLVPFGEYVPFHELIDNLLQLFVLPLSSLAPGPSDQPLLNAAGLRIAPFICYEVVYPDFARSIGRDADLLVTVSNDTWFGASFGPLQHLQMAAMRARELGRYMVRATNNGVSAFINARGEVVAETAQFKAETLQGSVVVYEGMTPFGRWGSWPVWLLCIVSIALSVRRRLTLPAPATTPKN
jgi:apolipoprotein N-acyltransferase